MSTSNTPIDSEWFAELKRDAALGKQLVAILLNHCGEHGETEGAVETLNRIIRERDRYVHGGTWVPVSERLPERNATVLYWHTPVEPLGRGWLAQADEWRDEQHLAYATHWMPMPEAPNHE